MATNAYYVINVYANARCFSIFNSLPRIGASNACWRFLAKLLKIEF